MRERERERNRIKRGFFGGVLCEREYDKKGGVQLEIYLN